MHQAVLARKPSAALRPLRFIRSSSAPLPARVHAELEEAFGVPVIEAYGMTEAAHQMASNPLPPRERKPGSVGLPTGAEIAVLGERRPPARAGEIGDVAIKGSTVFAGYESNKEANAESFVNGWFLTGDEGLLDDDGYLFLKGRSKEIINRGGEKVAPAEVEDAILGHPDVAQAVELRRPRRQTGRGGRRGRRATARGTCVGARDPAACCREAGRLQGAAPGGVRRRHSQGADGKASAHRAGGASGRRSGRAARAACLHATAHIARA